MPDTERQLILNSLLQLRDDLDGLIRALDGFTPANEDCPHPRQARQDHSTPAAEIWQCTLCGHLLFAPKEVNHGS